MTHPDETAWDAAAKDVDVRAVVALRSKGVRVEHLGRAAGFLQVMASDTVDQLKHAAEALRQDIPSLFESSTAQQQGQASDGKSAVQRAREAARASDAWRSGQISVPPSATT